jgi:hypothetical protein
MFTTRSGSFSTSLPCPGPAPIQGNRADPGRNAGAQARRVAPHPGQTAAGELRQGERRQPGRNLDGRLPHHTGPQFIPVLVTGLKAECPGVTLEFAEYAQPELQRDLRKGAENVPTSRIVLGYLAGTNLTARARRFDNYAVTALNHREAGQAAPAGHGCLLGNTEDPFSTLLIRG